MIIFTQAVEGSVATRLMSSFAVSFMIESWEARYRRVKREDMVAIWPSRLAISALSSREDIGRLRASLGGDATVVIVDGLSGLKEDSGLEIGLVPELAVIYLALQII